MTQTQMLDHALALAARGFQVFPLGPRSKDPYAGSHGHHDASSDEQQIRDWWTRAPDSNVGLRPSPGVIVLDVDPRSGGRETLAALEAEHGPLPDTLIAKTGGGGVHAYYSVPADLAWPKQLAAGIDLKGNSGYLVAPGSVHPSGAPYTWDRDAPIAPAPAWVLQHGRPQSELAARVVVEEDERTTDDAALDSLVADLRPYFVQGKKHYICKALGGWLKQRGFGFSDVAYVIARLLEPLGINPTNGISAAKWSFGVDKPTGWHELTALIGKPAADALDASTPNPRRVREKADLEAARALIPVPSAVHPLPAAGLPGPVPGAPHPAPAPTTLLERLRKRPIVALEDVLRTGVAPLDALLVFGGIPVSKNIMIGGAPDAGKTALMLQMAETFAAAGAAVAWVAVDEDADDIDSRRVQALGIPRVLAASGVGLGGLNDADLARIDQELGRRIFHVFENRYVEDVFAEMAARYPNHRRVVLIDSIQTARSRRSERATSPRERVDNLLHDIKAAQLTYPALWGATSELARAAYRNREQSENVDPMAAAKESGSIEYAAKLLLVLRSEGDDVVSVEIPKNKLGRKDPLRLKLDRATLRFTAALEASTSEKDRAVMAAIETALAAPDLPWNGIQIESLKSRVRNAGVSFPNVGTYFRDLVERLVTDGQVEHLGRCYRRKNTGAPRDGVAPPALGGGLAAAAAAGGAPCEVPPIPER